MIFEIDEPGTKIRQRTEDMIEVIEGGATSRVLGLIVLIAASAMMWSTRADMTDAAFIFGGLLALIGTALITQRFRMTLDRQRGIWIQGGEVLFIPIQSRGSLARLGPVRIIKRVTDLSGERRGPPVTSYPVAIEGKKNDGGMVELRFGQFWKSREEALNVAERLAEFLGRPVVHED